MPRRRKGGWSSGLSGLWGAVTNDGVYRLDLVQYLEDTLDADTSRIKVFLSPLEHIYVVVVFTPLSSFPHG